MPVRLRRPYNGQNAGTLYTGTDQAILRSTGLADDYIELATNYVPPNGNPFRPFASTFSAVAPAGAFLSELTNPFAGQGRGITTYATSGTVPPQIALSSTGRSLVVGATPGVAGTIYSISLIATSGDGLLVTAPVAMNFQAVAQTAIGGGGGPVTPKFTAFKTAVAGVQAGTRRATVLWIGDSTSVGEHGGTANGATADMDADSRSGAPANQMALALSSAGIPALNNGYMGDAGYGRYTGETFAAHNPQITFNGTWNENDYTNAYWGAIGGSPWYTSIGGSYLSLNPGIAFDTTKVLAWNTGGNVKIAYPSSGTNNGTNGVTVSATDGLTTVALQSASKVASGGIVNVAAPSAQTFTVCIQGVWAYDSTVPAIDVINAGVRGSLAANWLNSASPHAAFAGIAAIAPDLTIIMPPINDLLGGTSVATFTTQITNLITEAKKYGDVMLVNAAAISPASTNYANRPQFTAAMQALASQFNIPFTDLEAIKPWNSTEWFDNLHPLRAMYATMGQKVAADIRATLAAS